MSGPTPIEQNSVDAAATGPPPAKSRRAEPANGFASILFATAGTLSIPPVADRGRNVGMELLLCP